MAAAKKNIFLSGISERMRFSPHKGGPSTSLPVRDHRMHAQKLLSELEQAISTGMASQPSSKRETQRGAYVSFCSQPGKRLDFEALESISNNIRLSQVRSLGDSNDAIIEATVYIPEGKEGYFKGKIHRYEAASTESIENSQKHGLPRSVESINASTIESFWEGDPKDIPPEGIAEWCEIWLRYDDNNPNTNDHKCEVLQDFVASCRDLDIELRDEKIVFPDRLVKLAKADRAQLIALINACAQLASMRRAPIATDFFLDIDASEQRAWVDDLLIRTTFANGKSTVCVLDTGVTSRHPLLESAIEDATVQSVNPAWRADDHHGHGTGMAGIALYGDLKKHLISDRYIHISHKVESVKILPPSGENDPLLYGDITMQAVALAEVVNPYARRALCMAVTTSDFDSGDGAPTSWSAAVDRIAAGVDENDDHKRLFFISAGNITPSELNSIGYPEINRIMPAENPCQAWNAIVVGGYSGEMHPSASETDDGFVPVAHIGGLHPCSRTSVMWDHKKWPNRPDIVLDAGNIITNGHEFYGSTNLESLTTSSGFMSGKMFTSMSGTSPATAQAAWMAAKIYEEYPDIWPETVRALMIHSANWSRDMKEMFSGPRRSDKRMLLRTCGYGIPDLDKAIQCMSNSVNMIIQEELQPFETTSSSDARLNEMHMHDIPWPSEVLESLGSTKVTLRITLSYFIEPKPGLKQGIGRYRYPSCGLRFNVNNTNESRLDFAKRINQALANGEDRTIRASSGSERWYLGSQQRDVGSIHSDFMELSAVELCDTRFVAVYPVSGWWKYINDKANNKIRYSLVVSLSTEETNVDLYTPIIAQIENRVEIPTI